MKMHSNSEESKSDESDLEKKFMKDELGFKNNATMEERHSIDEAAFDEQSVKYSSSSTRLINDTEKEEKKEEEEKIKTTALPIVLTTVKKGKYLDLIRRDNDNINASIPNAAEVWALAGMRDIQSRTPAESDETSSSDVELLSGGLNNTAKNLLDWTEISKMSNESMTSGSDESFKDELTKTTVLNDISADVDPATSENKDIEVFAISRAPSSTSSTLKSVVEDNRIELENGNVEFETLNKTFPANSRIDSDVFANSHEEREESAVELIDSFRKNDKNSKKESLRVDEVELKNDFATTESAESFTTDSDEMVETTTTDNYETTTSIVDSFTVIGEEENSEDIFKRTITELPPLTTEQPSQTPITTQVPQTTTVANDKIQMELTQETTTESQSPSVNEIPESTLRYNKTTKSIRVATTTTDAPVEKSETTVEDNEGLSSTLIPKYKSVSQTLATTQHYAVEEESSSSPTVEIIDDDKFKYSTLLPETTTAKSFAKSGGFEESTTKAVDSLNKESLDGEQTDSGNLGLISIIVSVVIVLIVAGVAYVSEKDC